MDIILNSSNVLEIMIIDNLGNPVPGLLVTYDIIDSLTNISYDSGSLTDLGTGIYKKSITWNILGQYRILYSTPAGYEDQIETIYVVEDKIADVTDLIKRILGLTQENFRLFNTVYDVNNNLTSCTIKIYPSSTDCDNDTNEISEYSMTSTYNLGLLTDYKMTKV